MLVIYFPRYGYLFCFVAVIDGGVVFVVVVAVVDGVVVFVVVVAVVVTAAATAVFSFLFFLLFTFWMIRGRD